MNHHQFAYWQTLADGSLDGSLGLGSCIPPVPPPARPAPQGCLVAGKPLGDLFCVTDFKFWYRMDTPYGMEAKKNSSILKTEYGIIPEENWDVFEATTKWRAWALEHDVKGAPRIIICPGLWKQVAQVGDDEGPNQKDRGCEFLAVALAALTAQFPTALVMTVQIPYHAMETLAVGHLNTVMRVPLVPSDAARLTFKRPPDCSEYASPLSVPEALCCGNVQGLTGFMQHTTRGMALSFFTLIASALACGYPVLQLASNRFEATRVIAEETWRHGAACDAEKLLWKVSDNIPEEKRCFDDLWGTGWTTYAQLGEAWAREGFPRGYRLGKFWSQARRDQESEFVESSWGAALSQRRAG